ncbi:hypothetical protein ATANTOWER_027188 [Ataeniobius toweri]|uniref:Uncharacterized protein n=1 Tax=Ataeniobius toweri TaxID=208326 RepID=A0ABU7CCX5_9TELE|nr:hypothetical protein [Ataeniobius toweri]
MFHQHSMGFNSAECFLSLTSRCESPLFHFSSCKLVTKRYQTTDGSFSFSVSPGHKAVFLAVLQRDLHKAELLIASLQGACLDSGSHPFFLKKKKRQKSQKQQQKGFFPMLDLPCGVCQTKEDPLIWSQQGFSSKLTQKFCQEHSVLPL